MPTRIRTACMCRGCPSCGGTCPQSTSGGRCEGCTTQAQKSYHDKDRKKVYNSARWRGLRRQALSEQPWCATAGCTQLAHDVDHIVDLRDGGDPYARHNVCGLCKPCHSRKTNTRVFGRK